MADQTTQDSFGAWRAVRDLAAAPGARAIRAKLDAAPDRFARMSWRGAGLLLDLSRTSLTGETIAALLGFARARGVTAFRVRDREPVALEHRLNQPTLCRVVIDDKDRFGH